MNIVQQQHDLEMMGVPELQKLAQGTNPNVPAYLALAVLNQKMASREKAGLASGAAQGQQRSVAEQVDQKAGLMALDQQKQQQAQQMMAQQAQQTPQAVPEGVPAPQPQAQAQPTMMASGGIARLPIDPRMTDYAEGGVVAFAAGGDTGDALDTANEKRQAALAELRKFGTLQKRQNPEAFAQVENAYKQADAQYQQLKTSYEKEMSGTPAGRPAFGPKDIGAAAPQLGLNTPSPAPAPAGIPYDAATATRADQYAGPGLPSALPKPPAMPGAVPGAAPKPPATPGATGPGLPSAMPKPPAMPGAPVAPPAATGMQAQLAKEVAAPGTAPTPEGIMAERATMMPEELKTPADAGLKQRTAAMEEQYQGSKKDRDFERMLAVLGGGAKGGMGGFAPAYLGAVQGERTADTAHAAEMNRLLSGGENARRGEATSEYAGRTAGLAGAKTAFSDTERNRITALAQGAGFEQRAAEAMLSSLTQLEVERMRRATANQPGETERITAKYMALKAKDPKAAEEFMAGIERAKGAGKANPQAGIADKAYDNVLARVKSDMSLQGQYRKNPALFQAAVDAETKRLGGTIAAAPGAASPGGNTRMQFDAKGNPI